MSGFVERFAEPLGFAQGFGGQVRREPPPETEKSVRRREDDDEEDQADQRVEPIGADDVDRESLQEHIDAPRR